MSALAPLVRSLSAAVPAVGTAGNDATTPIMRAPFAGTVTGVTYVAASDITGAATHNRTVSLVNKGDDGTGTTTVASLQFAASVNAADYDETAITLSGTAANLEVDEGDVLAWLSTHIGNGITDPGGVVTVTFSRA